MRPRPPSKRTLGMLMLLAAAATCVVLSARFSARAHVRIPRPAQIETALADMLGVPVHVERTRLAPTRLGLAIEGFRMEIESWTVEVPRLIVRPHWRALLRGTLQPSATAGRFVLRTDAEDAPSVAQRLPELLEAIGLPDAHVELDGGQLRARNDDLMLGSVRFALDVSEEHARIGARARQRSGGRLEVRGVIERQGGLHVDAYLHGLESRKPGPWIRLLADPQRAGLMLPELQTATSGRWHVTIDARGATHHEFALDLHAGDPGAVSSGGAGGVDLRVVGSLDLELEGSDGDRRILPGAHVRVSGQAERLRVSHGDGPDAPRPSLLSGPFEMTLMPFGSSRRPILVAEARLDDAHVSLPIGLRKRAGTRARIGFARTPEPTASGRFRLALGGIEARGEIRPEGALVASTGWAPLTAVAELVPNLAQRATGGRLRVVSLRATGLDEFDALLEVEEGKLDGRKMPFAIESIWGRTRLTSSSFEADDLVASVAGVPMRVDLQADRSLSRQGASLRVRFRAEAETVALSAEPRSTASSDQGPRLALPPALQGIAEDQLLRLRDLALGLHVDIEEGVFRCARLQAQQETLRDLEIRMGLRSLRLELPRVVFQHRGRHHSYMGSIDLNPILPEVRIASLH